MHIVTKILIVFGAILTILLSALTISYAASETRVREDYKNVVAQKDRAQKEVQIAQAESSEKRSALAIAKDAAESAKADLEQQIKRLEAELGTRLRHDQVRGDVADALLDRRETDELPVERLDHVEHVRLAQQRLQIDGGGGLVVHGRTGRETRDRAGGDQ